MKRNRSDSSSSSSSVKGQTTGSTQVISEKQMDLAKILFGACKENRKDTVRNILFPETTNEPKEHFEAIATAPLSPSVLTLVDIAMENNNPNITNLLAKRGLDSGSRKLRQKFTEGYDPLEINAEEDSIHEHFVTMERFEFLRWREVEYLNTIAQSVLPDICEKDGYYGNFDFVPETESVSYKHHRARFKPEHKQEAEDFAKALNHIGFRARTAFKGEELLVIVNAFTRSNDYTKEGTEKTVASVKEKFQSLSKEREPIVPEKDANTALGNFKYVVKEIYPSMTVSVTYSKAYGGECISMNFPKGTDEEVINKFGKLIRSPELTWAANTQFWTTLNFPDCAFSINVGPNKAFNFTKADADALVGIYQKQHGAANGSNGKHPVVGSFTSQLSQNNGTAQGNHL